MPTRAIRTRLLRDSMRESISFHSPMLQGGSCKFSSLHTMSEKWCCSSITGAWYSTGRVIFSITQSGRTLQNMAILSRMDWSMGSSHRATMISGLMPMERSSFTECWVGLDLCSPELLMYGTRVTWMNRQFPFPTSRETWRMASRKGWLSMSPVVPPISVITTSAEVVFPTV